jgi:dUTP pyrophosphatase
MTVKFIKNLSNAKTPTRGSEYAAGYDLYSAESGFVPPHSTKTFNTGIAIELPENTFGGIFARSGLATKEGLRPANCVGVIDQDYRGNIIVALHNDSDEVKEVTDGERIAQLVILPYISVEFEEVDKLEETARAAGGFGSTGKN